MAVKRPDIRSIIQAEEAERRLPRTESHDETGSEPDVLRPISLRLPESVKRRLTRYFRETRGLDLSSGLRSWIYERMEREGVGR